MASQVPSPGSLAGLRVLDITGERGASCTRLLADMGADVVKLEPPGGEPSRGLAPFLDDVPGPNRSLWSAYLHAGKRSVTLDLSSPTGQQLARRLALACDVVVESQPVGAVAAWGLAYRSLCRERPGLVYASISPFGQQGPYAGFLGDDLIAQAMGGYMYLTGEPDRRPLRVPGFQAYHMAALHAAIGILTAIHYRDRTGQGQYLDISLQECVCALLEYANVFYLHQGLIARRNGSQHPQVVVRYVFPTSDGTYISLHPGTHWENWVDWLESEGLAQDLGQPQWSDVLYRMAHKDRINEVMATWTPRHTRQELFEEGQRRKLCFGAIHSPTEVLQDPHLGARRFFRALEHPGLGRKLVYAGPPFRASTTPLTIRRPAPAPGEHTSEVLRDLAGASPQELLAAALAGGLAGGARWPRARGGSGQRAPHRPTQRLPLADVRVADFTQFVAGPTATRILGDLGAQIIKVERTETGDPARGSVVTAQTQRAVNRSTYFNNLHRNKLSIPVAVMKPEGRALAKRLIAISDVVIDNFSSGVMERLGFGYKELRRVSPDVIAVSMPGMGAGGPYASYVSMAPALHALGGLVYLTGEPGRPPVGPGTSIADHFGGLAAALAVVMALHHRQRTGQGQFIEVAQLETLAYLLGVYLMEAAAHDRDPGPQDNRSHTGGLEDVYPCSGDDRWCAISIRTDADWAALGRALGGPPWAGAPHFATAPGRDQHRAELYELIAEWTSARSAEDAMHILQKAGVMAGVVQSAADLADRDPQLKRRGFFVTADHPELGPMRLEGMAIKLSRTPGRVRRGAPLLGEHTDFVARDLLGLREGEVNQLLLEGIV